MRVFRLALYLLVGVLLGASVTLAHAEVKYSSALWKPQALATLATEFCGAGLGFPSLPTSPYTCLAVETYPVPGCNRTAYWCKTTAGGNGAYFAFSGEVANNCPMYDGSSVVEPPEQPAGCTCPAGTKWHIGMGCRKKCDWGESGAVANAGWEVQIHKDQSQACLNGCLVQHGSGAYDEYANGFRSATAYHTGWSCSGNGTGTAPTPDGQPEPSAPAVPEAEKQPPAPKCPQGEGVITSSSGNVLCLPSGTPNTSQPQYNDRKRTETFPDGSTKTTETVTTRDPNTGATHTSTQTTVGTATNGQPGQAGTPGTTTGTVEESGNSTEGDQEGGDCEGEDCSDGAPPDFGEYGELYSPKYPQGLDGVLNEKINQMKATPFGQLTSQLVPSNVPSAGSCPTFSLGSNISAAMPFGGGAFQVPCYVWDFIRICMLIGSLLLARRLIFGG